MARYFFTYGTDGQPFYGGWTEVEAPNAHAAEQAFLMFHPKRNGFIDCATPCIPAERFKEDDMSKHGNFGACCQEKITITREVFGKEQNYDQKSE